MVFFFFHYFSLTVVRGYSLVSPFPLSPLTRFLLSFIHSIVLSLSLHGSSSFSMSCTLCFIFSTCCCYFLLFRLTIFERRYLVVWQLPFLVHIRSMCFGRRQTDTQISQTRMNLRVLLVSLSRFVFSNFFLSLSLSLFSTRYLVHSRFHSHNYSLSRLKFQGFWGIFFVLTKTDENNSRSLNKHFYENQH